MYISETMFYKQKGRCKLTNVEAGKGAGAHVPSKPRGRDDMLVFLLLSKKNAVWPLSLATKAAKSFSLSVGFGEGREKVMEGARKDLEEMAAKRDGGQGERAEGKGGRTCFSHNY